MRWRGIMIQSMHSKISWHRPFGASLHPSIGFCESPLWPLDKSVQINAGSKWVNSTFWNIRWSLGGSRCAIVPIGGCERQFAENSIMLWAFRQLSFNIINSTDRKSHSLLKIELGFGNVPWLCLLLDLILLSLPFMSSIVLIVLV